MTTLLGPIDRDSVTTLTGAMGVDLAMLTAAVVVSVVSGHEVIPGWIPERSEEVIVWCYEADWVSWKSLIADVCAVAHIPVPMIRFSFPSDSLLGTPRESDPDPDFEAYFAPYREADREATLAAGRGPEDSLFVVFGLDRAIEFGGDGAMAGLYRRFEGISTLPVGVPTAFHENSWGAGERWAGDFGRVLTLSGLRDSSGGVRDFYRVVGAVHAAEERCDRSAVPDLHVTKSPKSMTAGGFLAMEPPEVVRVVLTDGRSPEGQRIKEKARGLGITAGQLWHAAKRLEQAWETDSRATDGVPATLHGYLAVFDRWTEVDRWPDGNFMQRLARGCFTRTIEASRSRMKVNFQHGWNPVFRDKPLGPIVELTEDAFGMYYAVELDDTADNRRLALELEAGLYGSSYRLEVVAERYVKRPGRSAWNVRGLPERTIIEARLPNFGPVSGPLYPQTSAGIA
jgi:HK97 family phage prohead protease